MNRLLKTIAACALAVAVALPALAQNGTPYGKKFKNERSISASELNTRMGDKTKLENVVVKGEIAQVCQAEGCWLRLKNENGEDIFVKFKDHSFTIPKDLAGRRAIVNGTAMKKVVSVEELRHYAEDEGKSADEVGQITEPKTELRVSATGVIIE